MEDWILVKYQRVGGPGSYQESAGTLTSTHTHERDSPKMPTVLVEGRVEKRSGEKRGEEKGHRLFCFGLTTRLTEPAPMTYAIEYQVKQSVSSQSVNISASALPNSSLPPGS